MPVILKPHQATAVNNLHNGACLAGGVGVGKTITALHYYYEKVCGGQQPTPGREFKKMSRPRDLYVITTARKRDDKDWEKEAALYSLSRDPDLNGVTITVDSWNNVANYTDIQDAFFIFDEQRLVGAGAWVKAFLKIAEKNEWILLSATPGDTWMDYIPLFIANGFFRNRSDFIEQHVVFDRFAKFPKVKKFLGVPHLEKLRQRVIVDMPFERLTTRHILHKTCDFDRELYEKALKKRWDVFEDVPMQNSSDLFRILRKINNSDPSRLGAVMEIFEEHPRLIIFYNFNYELEMLRGLGRSLGVLTKEWNGQKHEEVPEGDSWLYLVQYTAGSEAWNCITTDTIVFFSQNYSYKVMEQSMGRTDRMNTPYRDLYYYILRSGSSIDQAIHKALRTKKNFNERAFDMGEFPEVEHA